MSHNPTIIGGTNGGTYAIEALLEGEAEALTRKAVDVALAGDTTALRLCLERIAPPRKDTPVCFELPAISNAGEASNAAASILKAVAEAEITPIEGSVLMGLVENFRRILEMTEIEARLTSLEEST